MNIYFLLCIVIMWNLVQTETQNHLEFENEGIITLKYYVFFGRYTLPIYLNQGTSAPFYKVIDQSCQYLTLPRNNDVNNNFLLYNDEKIIETISIPSNDNDNIIYIKSTHVIGDIFLTDSLHIPLDYLLIQNNNNITSCIPFSHKFNDNSFSLLHSLYINKHIKRLYYAISSVYNGEDSFYLGGIPIHTLSNKTLTTCKTNPNSIEWTCNLDYVYYNNYNNNGELFETSTIEKYNAQHINVAISSSDYSLYAPSDFLKYLTNTLFQKHIKEGKCNYLNITSLHLFGCDCRTIYSFPNLNFVLSGKIFSIKMSTLFEIYDPGDTKKEFCELMIKKSTKWIFGIAFINKYLIGFDYENDVVEIYSDESLDNYENVVEEGTFKKAGKINNSENIDVIGKISTLNIIIMLIAIGVLCKGKIFKRNIKVGIF